MVLVQFELVVSVGRIDFDFRSGPARPASWCRVGPGDFFPQTRMAPSGGRRGMPVTSRVRMIVMIIIVLPAATLVFPEAGVG